MAGPYQVNVEEFLPISILCIGACSKSLIRLILCVPLGFLRGLDDSSQYGWQHRRFQSTTVNEVNQEPRDRAQVPGALMTVALAAATWSIAIGGHELIGHGGVCAIDPGCRWIAADAMYFDGTRDQGPWLNLQRAAGSVFNVTLALLAALWLHRRKPTTVWAQVALWLTITINLFQAGSYIAFGWVIHPGMDWARLAAQIQPLWFGHAAVTVSGLLVVAMGFALGAKLWPQSIAGPNRIRNGLWIAGLAYLACGVVSVTASLLVPHPDRMLMLAGGIGNSFGFVFWLLFLALLAPSGPKTLQRGTNGPVLAAALSLTALYVFALGPGIQFG